MYKILSIDGGGIRGLIPALVLAELEQRCGKPVSKLFNMVAGTSTGGIIALGLTAPDAAGEPRRTANDMVSLYEKDGKKIFSRSFFTGLTSLWSPKYSPDGLETVLKDSLGDAYLQVALTEVLITSYEIENSDPFLFKRWRARENPNQYDFQMWQVARATSAAPTYFPPARFKDRLGGGGDKGYYACVDGGLFANNPAMCALAEARDLNPAETDFLVISLGTGQMDEEVPYEKAKGWGLVGWAEPIIPMMFDGNSDTVEYQLSRFCHAQAGAQRVFRFQTKLNAGNAALDNVEPRNLVALRSAAKAMIESQSEDLDRVCALLA